MKLSMNGIKEQEAWNKAGITLPGYDVAAVSERARKEPGWIHFGIGNIFRIFIGGIADGLLEDFWIVVLPVWKPLIMMW